MVNIHEDARRKRHVQHAEDEWQPCVKENSKNRNNTPFYPSRIPDLRCDGSLSRNMLLQFFVPVACVIPLEVVFHRSCSVFSSVRRGRRHNDRK